MAHVVTAEEAVRKIPDGATVLVNPMPAEEVFPAFGRVFEATGHPKDLVVVWAAGLGPFSAERRGMNHFAWPGMVRRFIAGHVGLNHLVVKMIASEQCEAYNLPQGVMSQLYRDIAAHRPGLLTRIGLGTFVDPRIEGGKMNARTRACEDLVELMTIGGREMLFYKAFPVHVGVFRGTSADPNGNITCEREALTMESLEVAMAAKNHGGIVIAQVEELRNTPAHPHHVHVPGLFVDYVVVASSRKNHPHTLFVEYDPSFCGESQADLSRELEPLPLNLEKIICRRAAMELRPGMAANLGVGIPTGVASVAHEQGFFDKVALTTEVGALGGVPERGFNFGPAKNPQAIISQPQMFDFYHGQGLDATFVGLAQADAAGNVNVSRLGPKLIGSGGFIDITQTAKKCVFCGEFTAGGLDARAEDGQLVIHREGKAAKFVENVDQITFSGRQAMRDGQEVIYVTERCVFRLVPEGMQLAEVAPGVDIQRDLLGHMAFKPIIPDSVPDPRLRKIPLAGSCWLH
ncbi:MAG TPA: CoA-transferase, partial [Candidatus Hydrogenedentes bacterium]|nr:CoA-transferase [Candidatus Hydrogenedentota bacterium]